MKRLVFFLLPLVALPAAAATFALNALPGLAAPSTRGTANTTYYGWDTFTGNPGSPGFPNLTAAINDSTPELGANPGLALIVTNNGEDHISSSGNYYSSTGAVNETVTFDTSGVLGTGFTTLILQGVTAFGPFGTPLTFSDINGVSPVVVQGTNAAGNDQFWAKWEIPGNQRSYTGTLLTGANSFVSLDLLSVDTYWNAGGYQPDAFAVPEPGTAAALLLAGAAALGRRRRA